MNFDTDKSPKELTQEKADWSKREAFEMMKRDRDATYKKLDRARELLQAFSAAGEKTIAALRGTEAGTLSDTVFAIRHYEAIAVELEEALSQYYKESGS